MRNITYASPKVVKKRVQSQSFWLVQNLTDTKEKINADDSYIQDKNVTRFTLG